MFSCYFLPQCFLTCYFTADLMKNKSKELLQTMREAPVKKLFGKARQKVKATYTTLGGAISVVGTLDCDKKDTKKVFK